MIRLAPLILSIAAGAQASAASLQELIDATPPGARLELPAGVYQGPATIGKDLVLAGAGPDRTIILGEEEWFPQSALEVTAGATIAISGIAFRDGHAYAGGGAILNRGALTISNCGFTGNLADAGGAIHNFADANLQIFDCIFANNTAWKFGGAIDNRGTATIQRVLFEANVASNGGGIHTWPAAWGVMSLLEDCRFQSNVVRDAAGPTGGAADGALTMRRCVVYRNVARGGAGAGVFGSGSILEDCLVTHNTVEPFALSGRGGGVSGDVILRNTTVCRNWALEAPDVSGEITSLGGNVIGECEPLLRIRIVDGVARLEAAGANSLQAADSPQGPWATLTLQDAPFVFVDFERKPIRFYRLVSSFSPP